MIVLAACGGASQGEIARTYDPCAPITLDTAGATAEQANGIAGGVALWRGAGVTGFDASTGETIGVRFQTAAPAFHGFYDDTAGVVYVNTDVVDSGELAIVVAHELGHAFGLVHVQDRTSLMNPGNLTTPPTDGDRAALAALWGACP
jgi:matrixin